MRFPITNHRTNELRDQRTRFFILVHFATYPDSSKFRLFDNLALSKIPLKKLLEIHRPPTHPTPHHSTHDSWAAITIAVAGARRQSGCCFMVLRSPKVWWPFTHMRTAGGRVDDDCSTVWRPYSIVAQFRSMHAACCEQPPQCSTDCPRTQAS